MEKRHKSNNTEAIWLTAKYIYIYISSLGAQRFILSSLRFQFSHTSMSSSQLCLQLPQVDEETRPKRCKPKRVQQNQSEQQQQQQKCRKQCSTLSVASGVISFMSLLVLGCSSSNQEENQLTSCFPWVFSESSATLKVHFKIQAVFDHTSI